MVSGAFMAHLCGQRRGDRLGQGGLTNVPGAYNRGRYLGQAESADVFPYLIYDAVDDSATRPRHRALDGLILEFGSEEAERVYPPNGFQCRCVMRGLTRRQAETRGVPSRRQARALIDANPPGEGWEGPPFEGGAHTPGGGLPPVPELKGAGERLKEKGAEVVPDAEFLKYLGDTAAYPAAARAKARIPESPRTRRPGRGGRPPLDGGRLPQDQGEPALAGG
jgi:hypothetical protein